MRLLHTATITLSSFYDDSTPPYAILSHTWGSNEISFHDLLRNVTSELDESEGYSKIKSCCALAATDGFDYVWIDTCCIDKTSSAEMSEAINSMYRWYQEAQVCYAYLSDVPIGDPGPLNTGAEKAFRESRWFTRGWTLQELLAPKKLVFYDKDWREFGSKSKLRATISFITGIQQDHMIEVRGASAAQKMSWASGRRTTRVEDRAYSLMGIFDVNMPLLYGEGNRAFTRLQHEIVKISDDESIFAWTDDSLGESGMFAQSPQAFAESGNVVQIIETHPLHVRRAPYTVTNRGLAIEVFASKENAATIMSNWGISFIPLNCGRQPGSGAAPDQQLVIELENISRDEFVRSSPGQLSPPMWPINVNSTRLVYVRPLYTLYDPDEQLPSFLIKASSVLERGFSISDTYDCEVERFLWSVPPHERPCEMFWRITHGRGQGIAAVLLKSNHYGAHRQLFGIIFHTAESSSRIDLIVPLSAQSFQWQMDTYKSSQSIYLPSSRFFANPISTKLQDDRWVSVVLARRREWRLAKGTTL